MADEKISDMPAMSALAGTEKLAGVQSSINAVATPLQLRTYALGPNGAPLAAIGVLTGANFNVTTDQAIPILMPVGFTRWRPNAIFITNASGSITTAAGGFYPTTAKGGTALVANTQTYTTLTGAAVNATGSLMAATLAAGITNTSYDLTTIYLSLTTPQGSAMTADIYLQAAVFP